jgi:hypothetical protein
MKTMNDGKPSRLCGGLSPRQDFQQFFVTLSPNQRCDVPSALVEQIRKREGLPLEPPKASEFIDNE